MQFNLLRPRAPQCQDGPQSDNGGAPGRERLHVDTEHSQLDLVQQVHRRPGLWADNDEGRQVHGELKTEIV